MHSHKKKNSQGGVATMEQAAPPRKAKKHLKKIILLVLLVLVAGFVGYRIFFAGKQQAQVSTYTLGTAQTRDIVSSLTGKGTLKPADSYTVTSLLKGEVKQADFEEGDKVTKDTVLYVIDSSDATTNYDRSENALENAQRAYARAQESLADLNVRAPAAGQVVNLTVKAGDKVAAGQTLGTIRDSQTVTVKLAFPTDEAQKFYVGQTASVTLDGSFETLSGRVTEISGADEVLTGNRIVRRVSIELTNPGAITPATKATATIGSSACAEAGSFAYKAEKPILAEAGGDVATVSVSEGQSVLKDQILVSLTSSAVTDAVASARSAVDDAQLSLDSQSNVLDDYTIKSPIDGTVIEKDYKQGDNMESGKILCIIYDLDYLEFTMNVDELDISNIAVGQSVAVTAEAVPGRVFDGKVTKLSINGVTAGGVTTYPVTVRVEKAEGLLPGMNVDASVFISRSTGAVSVPVEALKRGNQVLVKTGADTDEPIEPGLPAGYTWVEVTVGNSDDSFIEIRSGLQAGDEIAYELAVAPPTNALSMIMGGGEAMSDEEAPPPAAEGGDRGPGGAQ